MNYGVLFRNTKKTKSSHPDFTGNCEVNGVKYYLSGWTKQSQNGEPFISFALKLPNENASKELKNKFPFE